MDFSYKNDNFLKKILFQSVTYLYKKSYIRHYKLLYTVIYNKKMHLIACKKI